MPDWSVILNHVPCPGAGAVSQWQMVLFRAVLQYCRVIFIVQWARRANFCTHKSRKWWNVWRKWTFFQLEKGTSAAHSYRKIFCWNYLLSKNVFGPWTEPKVKVTVICFKGIQDVFFLYFVDIIGQISSVKHIHTYTPQLYIIMQ